MNRERRARIRTATTPIVVQVQSVPAPEKAGNAEAQEASAPTSSWPHRHHVLSASPFTAMSTKAFLSLLALLLLRPQVFGQESVIRAHRIGVHDGVSSDIGGLRTSVYTP